jgi:hypothetical protein
MYHGLARCILKALGFLVRPKLNSGKLGRHAMTSDLWGDDPDHGILPAAWAYEIVGLRLEKEPEDGLEPYLDLFLRKGTDRLGLRFWSPQDLEVERGGPVMTHGLRILDLSARGLDGLGVRVTDGEGTIGAIRFVARAVEPVGAGCLTSRGT